MQAIEWGKVGMRLTAQSRQAAAWEFDKGRGSREGKKKKKKKSQLTDLWCSHYTPRGEARPVSTVHTAVPLQPSIRLFGLGLAGWLGWGWLWLQRSQQNGGKATYSERGAWRAVQCGAVRYVGVYVCLSRGGRSERRDSELPELLFTVQAKLCFGMDNDWGRSGSRRRRESGGGKIECGSGGVRREQKGRGQRSLLVLLSLCRRCVYMWWLVLWLVVVVVDAGGDLCLHAARLRDCERPATKKRNETEQRLLSVSARRRRKRRDAAQQRQRLAMEDKERSKAHEAVTQTAT